MPIIIRGSTKCLGCGKSVEKDEPTASFSPFVTNEADPLWPFNDAVLHQNCFDCHPLADRVRDAYGRARRMMEPQNRKCAICERSIDDPDEHFALGWLTSEEESPLSEWNEWQAHWNCLANWADLPKLFDALQSAVDRGELRGAAVDRILDRLADFMPVTVHTEQQS